MTQTRSGLKRADFALSLAPVGQERPFETVILRSATSPSPHTANEPVRPIADIPRWARRRIDDPLTSYCASSSSGVRPATVAINSAGDLYPDAVSRVLNQLR